MARIYKTTDRIKVKIDDITVTLAPLEFNQKQEGQAMILRGQKQEDEHAITKGVIQFIKWSLKDIEGVEDSEGIPYKIKFHNNEVSDESISDLMNLEIHPKLMQVCSSLAITIPQVFLDQKGKPLKGVELLPSNKKEKQNPN